MTNFWSLAAAAASLSTYLLGLASAADERQTEKSPPPVYTFANHGEAILGWAQARLDGHLPARSDDDRSGDRHHLPPDDRRPEAAAAATLIHFDSHADMGIPPYFSGIGTGGNLSPLELAQSVSINDFIPPAILEGLVDHVVWVKPAWGWEMEYGTDREFYVAEDREGRVFRSDAPFFRPDAPFTGDADVSDDDRAELVNKRHYRVDVVPFEEEALYGLGLSADKPFIIDVDLDVFSTENPACHFLRDAAGLSLEDVEWFAECSCPDKYLGADDDEVECEMATIRGHRVPAIFADAVADLPDYQFRIVTNEMCVAPVHYSKQDEIQAAVELMFSWVDRLKETGLAPGVITVAESTDSYLPPQALGSVKGVATRLAEAFGSTTQWIECSICTDFSFENDLQSDEVDLFFVDYDGEDENDLLFSLAVWHSTLQPGQVHDMETFAGNHFLLTTLDGRLFHVQIPKGEKDQGAAVSKTRVLERRFSVLVHITNDLDAEVEVFRFTAESNEASWSPASLERVNSIGPRESMSLSAVAGNKFVLRAVSGETSHFLLRISTGDSEISVRVSELDVLNEPADEESPSFSSQ